MTSLIRDARLDRQYLLLAVGARLSEPQTEGNKIDIAAMQQPAPALTRPSRADTNDRPAAIESLAAAENPSLVAAESLAENQADHAEILRLEKELAQREGKEQGYRVGYETGFSQGQAEYEERISRLESVVVAANGALEQGIEGVEDAAVEIVFAAVCRILGTALADRDGVAAVVRRVIDHAKDREKLIIRVSPSDFNLLKDEKTGLMHDIALANGGLTPDERVVLGGCLLETAGGNLDGRLEIQLDQFREALLSARTRRVDDSDGPMT